MIEQRNGWFDISHGQKILMLSQAAEIHGAMTTPKEVVVAASMADAMRIAAT